jgi:pimeloyl-ACP methyl ester carboxylesterase
MTLPVRNSRIRLSQGQLFCREIGDGKAVLFLHGSWRDGSQWLSVMEQLGSKQHCFAPDLLGCGDSEHPKINYSIELLVESLAEYLDAAKVRDVWLVGHEVGGWVAAGYALRYPAQVKGLVLIGAEGVNVEGASTARLTLAFAIAISHCPSHGASSTYQAIAGLAKTTQAIACHLSAFV